jgi:hypothetical protein
MTSKTLAAAIAVILLAGATLSIGGASATPAAPSDLATTSDDGIDTFDGDNDGGGRGDWRDHRGPGGDGQGHGRAMMRGGRGMMGRRMMAMHVAKDPQLSTIRDLRALEGAYRHGGREKDVASIYTDVLKRTSDPVVRDFANHRLARIAMRAGDTKGAIDRLNNSLDDDLKRLK